MKNFFALLLIFLLIPIVVFSQTNTEKQKEWFVFVPQLEEFSVEVPGSFTDESFTLKKENRRYTALIDGTYFYIFSDTKKEDFQYKTVLKFVESHQKTELEKQKNSDVMKFSFSDDEDFYHTIYTAKTQNRLYAFHLVSKFEDDSSVKRFFKSLKINEQTLANDFDEPKTETENSVTDNQQFEVRKIDRIESDQDTGTGSGFGRGSGHGSGVGNARNDSINSSTEENLVSKALNITSKPKPKYTDFARFYNISGTVRMRTTFLKDGTIGSTTAISKLPFGLTNSALTAAKQMRFEPQIFKGQAVSVTKVIVFSFVIY